MCKLSNKLQLCTCNTNLDALNNYWVLHRFVKDKHDMVIGEPMMPFDISPTDDAYNKKLLIQLLNEGNVFDIELTVQPKDRLQLSFKLGKDAENNMVHYGFEYSKGKWKECEFDGLTWMWKHEEAHYGTIKNEA